MTSQERGSCIHLWRGHKRCDGYLSVWGGVNYLSHFEVNLCLFTMRRHFPFQGKCFEGMNFSSEFEVGLFNTFLS